jgi:hypothetical protein
MRRLPADLTFLLLFLGFSLVLDARPLAPVSPVIQSGWVVPRVLQFSGVLKDGAGSPLTGTVGVTFALYKEQQGGTPLWLESQNVSADPQGNYSVLLGATKGEGLPVELFASGESRWLGIQAQAPGEVEQPRILLVSVPYALKAADADTIGGKPASAFVLADTVRSNSKTPAKANVVGQTPNVAALTGGAPGALGKFDVDGVSLVNSVVTENSGRIGVNTSSPQAPLQVSGSSSASLGARNALQLDNNNPLANSSSGVVLSKSGTALWHLANDFEANGTQSFYIYDNIGNHIGLYIAPSGNVGIGTSNPQSRFELSSSGSALLGARNALQIDNSNPSGNGSNALLLTRGGTPLWHLGNDFEANGTQSFYLFDHAAGAPRFYVDPAGNMGLGTITPAAKLDVAGGANVSGGLTATTLAGSGSALTNLNATNVTSGTLPVARGGTGVSSAQGNGSKIQLSTGSTITDRCVKFDASGNTVDAGAACGTITSVSAGAGLTGGAASGGATLAMSAASRTRGIVYLGGCDTCSALVDNDDQKTIYLNVIGPMTINSVTCFSDVGSPTINIQRGGVSPANILTSDLACSTSGATTTSFAISTLNLNETLDFVMVTAGGTAHRVTVAIQATVN